MMLLIYALTILWNQIVEIFNFPFKSGYRLNHKKLKNLNPLPLILLQNTQTRIDCKEIAGNEVLQFLGRKLCATHLDSAFCRLI